MPMIKDMAYARRHMIFHLSVPEVGSPRSVIDHRPHRALGQQPPNPTRPAPRPPAVKIQRRPILDGLINEYAQAA